MVGFGCDSSSGTCLLASGVVELAGSGLFYVMVLMSALTKLSFVDMLVVE